MARLLRIEKLSKSSSICRIPHEHRQSTAAAGGIYLREIDDDSNMLAVLMVSNRLLHMVNVSAVVWLRQPQRQAWPAEEIERSFTASNDQGGRL